MQYWRMYQSEGEFTDEEAEKFLQYLEKRGSKDKGNAFVGFLDSLTYNNFFIEEDKNEL